MPLSHRGAPSRALTFVATLVAVTVFLATLAGPAEAANVPPECHGTTMAVAPGGERTFSLRCQDFDGPQAPMVEIVDAPDHATATVVDGLRVHVEPAAGYTGGDSFTFRVSDGANQTAAVVQELRITDDDLAPQCLELNLTTTFVTYSSFENPCFDPNEGDAVRVSVSTPAQHGWASIEGSSVTYSAGAYVGSDTFSLQASDGDLTGPPAESHVDAQALTAPVCDVPPTIDLRTNHEERFVPVCRDNARPQPIPFGYDVTDEPDHGQLDVDYGVIVYTPDHDYEGDDSFTFRASSSAAIGEPATLDSQPVTVSFRVADDVNAPPECGTIGVLRLRAGTSRMVPGGCSDADDDPVSVTVERDPSHGALARSWSGPFATTVYTADEGYAGSDSYSLRGYDGRSRSELATQHLWVLGPQDNTAPECSASAVRAIQGRGTPVSLACGDAEGDTLTYTVQDGPDHGTIAPGSGPAPPGGRYFVYTPASGYTGDDRITYRAADGHGGQTVDYTILIDVVAPSPPRCSTPPPYRLRTDRTAHVTVWCHDDNGTLDTELVTPPAHGTAHEQAMSGYTYTPAGGYTGDDSFEVRAQNAHGTRTVVVQVEIADDVNYLPRCQQGTMPTTREAPITLSLSCHDSDGDALTFAAVTGPEHGSLAWDHAAKKVTYTPNPGFKGYDEFRWRAYDGRGHSVAPRQRIRVRGIDDNAIPRCAYRGTVTQPGAPVSLYASCRDADDDPLTIAVVDPPEHGTVTGPDSYGRIVYTPAAGFTGMDELGVTANDGKATSPVGRYSIQVGQVTAPQCEWLAANVVRDTARRVRLTCRSWFGAPVAPRVADGPDHGTLSAIDGEGWVTYTPDAGFEGTDSFAYDATDSGVTGPPARVELRIAASPPPAGAATPPPAEAPPPPPPPAPSLPDPPPTDPGELAAEQRLGGDAVKAPGVTLGGTRAFVPVAAAGGVLTVDAPSEKLLALVCPASCDVSAALQIVLGGANARGAAATPIRLRAQRLKLRAGQAGVVVLRLTKAQRLKVRRARKATLKVALAVRDARGRTVRDTTWFRLRAR